MFLFFLLFEDRSEDHKLIEKTMENVTDFDYLLYLMVEDIDAAEYYDANRILKLKDKLTPEVGKLLDRVVTKLKDIGQQISPKEFLK